MSTEGKSIADDIVSGLCAVTKLWAKQRKQEERHASARANRLQRLLRSRQRNHKGGRLAGHAESLSCRQQQ